MHAQLIENTTCARTRRGAQPGDPPRARGRPARAGGLLGGARRLDPETRTGLLVVLWETGEEAARPLAQCDAPLLAALAAVAEVSAGALPPSTVWEVSCPWVTGRPPVLPKHRGWATVRAREARAGRCRRWIGHVPTGNRTGEDKTCTA